MSEKKDIVEELNGLSSEKQEKLVQSLSHVSEESFREFIKSMNLLLSD